MMGQDKAKTAFKLTGRFLDYVLKDTYKIKAIRLATAAGEKVIKLPKGLRYATAPILQPGAWVQVHGQQNIDRKTGQTQLKALAIALTTPSQALPTHPTPETVSISKPAEGQIRVCHKSSCRQRGSQAVWSALTTALDSAGLMDTVRVKPVKCLGKCKAGPNLIISPGKVFYSQVQPQQAAEIVQSHF